MPKFIKVKCIIEKVEDDVSNNKSDSNVINTYEDFEAKTTLDYILKRIKRVPLKDLRWVQELARWQSKFKNNKEFSQDIQVDFFHDRIFIYTPLGDVKDLPSGSTPIDFAYSIHSEVGNSCQGAKVNGKMKGLDTKLQNGDIVEIITNSKKKIPSADWLKISATSLARTHIRKALRLKEP